MTNRFYLSEGKERGGRERQGGEEVKRNKNDIVYTPYDIAGKIIEYFNPKGFILEPCRGGGAFYKQFKEPKEWCEIQEGRDFMNWDKRVDWIITNPPFSEYSLFFKKALEIADNIVFLIPLNKVFRNMGELKLLEKWGGIHTILILGTGSVANFNFGFVTGCIYLMRGYKDKTKIEFLDLEQKDKLFEGDCDKEGKK
jgi:hypothetical protein